MPAELYALIVLGHRDLYDHLKVSSSAARVPIARGVRQGCRIAPMLWAIATAVLMQRTDKSIRLQWTRDNLTAYAHDFRTGERICKCTDLDRSLWCCGTFLDELVDANFSPRALRPLGRRVMSAKVLRSPQCCSNVMQYEVHCIVWSAPACHLYLLTWVSLPLLHLLHEQCFACDFACHPVPSAVTPKCSVPASWHPLSAQPAKRCL